MGYFQFIDGKKYDRSLLNAAEAVLEGKSINKFTIKDAERIYGAFLVDGELTASERRTLDYLIQNYPWTIRAKSWIINEIEAVPVSSSEIAEHIIEDEFELHRLKLQIDKNDIADQSGLDNQIQFEEALRLALNSFLRDGSRETSAVKSLAKLYDIPVAQGEFRELLDSILKEHFNHATLTLLPQISNDQQDITHNFPTKGELVRRNWIFGLSLHDIPDFYFWAIIDRTKEIEPYNYGAPIKLPVYSSPTVSGLN